MSQSKLRPALIGGAALGVASSIPILKIANCACCALVIGGGVLAAYLYMKDAEPSPKAPFGDSVSLGLLTGVIGAVVGTIITIPLFLLFSSFAGISEVMDEALKSADLPDEARRTLERLGESGFLLGVLLVVRNFLIYPIFATIGALIGVAIFNKKPSVQAP